MIRETSPADDSMKFEWKIGFKEEPARLLAAWPAPRIMHPRVRGARRVYVVCICNGVCAYIHVRVRQSRKRAQSPRLIAGSLSCAYTPLSLYPLPPLFLRGSRVPFRARPVEFFCFCYCFFVLLYLSSGNELATSSREKSSQIYLSRDESRAYLKTLAGS